MQVRWSHETPMPPHERRCKRCKQSGAPIAYATKASMSFRMFMIFLTTCPFGRTQPRYEGTKPPPPYSPRNVHGVTRVAFAET